MKKNFWLRLAAVLLSLLLLSGAAFADERGDLTLADLNDMAAIAQSVEGKVTLMLYMCGSSLESERGYASGDLAEVMASGFDEQKVTVLVMAGGSASDWKLPGIRSDATCIYRLTASGVELLWTDEQQHNMADPETLNMFVSYGYTFSPADSYALVIWDHGGGALGGVCLDENFYDMMSLNTLEQALRYSPAAEQPLEWLGFDACLMGTVEVAAKLAPYAHYLIASEESEPGCGWNYAFVKGLDQDESGADSGRRIIDDYFAVPTIARNGCTLSCVDLSYVAELESAVDSFFADMGGKLTARTYKSAYASRKNARRYGESDRSDFDLVDLMDVVLRYGESFGVSTEAMQRALADTVVYSRATSKREGSTGLSIYHPFYNSGSYQRRLNEYSTFGFSGEYTAYIRKFGDMLTGAVPVTNVYTSWADIQAALMANKDMRTLVALQLNDAQLYELVGAEIVALQRGENGWHLVAHQPAAIGETGLVSGEYVHTNLFVVDESGAGLAGVDVPLLYSVDSDGMILVPVTLTDSEGRRVEARLICSRDEDNGDLTVEDLYLCDTVNDNSFLPRMSALIEDYAAVTVTVIDRAETRGENGELLPFDQWEEVGRTDYTWRVDGGWKLAFVRDHLATDSLSLAFALTDLHNSVRMSELVAVDALAEDAEGMHVVYDDADLLRIGTENIGLIRGANGSVRLTMQVTNLTMDEALVSAEHIVVNGRALDIVAEVFGTGANDGLAAQETQMLTIQLKAADLEGVESLQSVTFDLVVLDAAEAPVGQIPVTIQLNYPL